MPNTFQFKRGALAGLPSLSAGEPGFTTDQFRLYVGSAGGNRPVGVLLNLGATAAPTAGDDSADGYSPGSVWIDTTNDKSYVCVDSTVGAAVWQQTSGTGTGGITQLTGDVTAGPGSGSQAATLAASGVSAGTYGSSSLVPVVTVDAKGRVTSLTTASVASGLDIAGLTATDLDLLDEFPLYDVSAAANRKVTLDRLVARAATPPPGRLTLSATLPIDTANTTSSTLVYYLTGLTGSDRIRLWDGTRWVVRPLGTGTVFSGSWSNSTVYDLFAYADSAVADTTDAASDRLVLSTSPNWTSGTPVYVTATGGGLTAGTVYYWNRFAADTGSFHTTQADAVAGTNKVDLTGTISGTVYAVPLERVAWTNDTTRATALALADGAYYKSGDRTRLYLGTVRTNGSSIVQDTVAARFVWNAYNRRSRPLRVTESADNWTYGTTSWRSFNNSTANRVELVIGLSEDPVTARALGTVVQTGGSGQSGAVGIGVDSTTANSAQLLGIVFSNDSATIIASVASGEYAGYPGVGYHYLQMLEFARAGTVRFDGDAGTPTSEQSGLSAEVWA